MNSKFKEYIKYLDNLKEVLKKDVLNGSTKLEEPLIFICKEHGEYIKTLRQNYQSIIKYDNSCPKCIEINKNKKKRRTEYSYMSDIRSDYQERIRNGEINNRTKIPFINCKEHGEYWQSLSNHEKGKGCPKCGKEKVIERNISTRRTEYSFINEIREDYQILIKNGEIKQSDKIPFICNKLNKNGIKHGEYWQVLDYHISGCGCPKCGRENNTIKRTRIKYDFIDDIREDYRKKIINGEISSHTKVPFICQTHGEYWQELISHASGYSCPKCGDESGSIKRTKTDYDFIDEVRYDYRDPIRKGKITQNIKVPFICQKDPNHGEYWQTLFSHNNGHGCPKCSKIISKSEMEVSDHIKSILPNNIEVLNNKKKLLDNPYIELDIYIPSMNMGIEYNGLRWHSEKIHEDRYNLNTKTKLFNDIGIRVIHIFEDEWLNQRNLIQNKLKHILNMDNSEKVYGRNCYVKEINLDICKEFLMQNHLQGYYRSKHRYGLFIKNNDNLIAVMTFINSKISSSLKDWELSRYATNCNVIGGFGKLLKYAQLQIGFKKLITFADLRWSDPNNNIYLNNGFIQEYITRPNYYYVKEQKRIHRFSMRKTMLAKRLSNYDPNLTEVENCNNNGYYRLFDCGNIKYIKEFS